MCTYLPIVKIVSLIGFILLLAPPYNFVQEGAASYYASSLQGHPTASGTPYHPDSLTAAHRYLPLGTKVVVTNTVNQRQVNVTINDRGPFHPRRIVDLSRRAADSLDIRRTGVGNVILQAQLPPKIAKQVQKKIELSTKQ